MTCLTTNNIQRRSFVRKNERNIAAQPKFFLSVRIFWAHCFPCEITATKRNYFDLYAGKHLLIQVPCFYFFFFVCPDIFPPWDLSKLNALICETPCQENCHSFPGCQQKRNLKCKFNLRQDARLKAFSRPVVPRFNCPNEKDEGPAGKTGKWVVGK